MQPSTHPDSDPTPDSAPDPTNRDPSSDDPGSSTADAGSHGRRFASDERHCELCGFPLFLEHHCKIVCPNCGFTRDCSDP